MTDDENVINEIKLLLQRVESVEENISTKVEALERSFISKLDNESDALRERVVSLEEVIHENRERLEELRSSSCLATNQENDDEAGGIQRKFSSLVKMKDEDEECEELRERTQFYSVANTRKMIEKIKRKGQTNNSLSTEGLSESLLSSIDKKDVVNTLNCFESGIDLNDTIMNTNSVHVSKTWLQCVLGKVSLFHTLSKFTFMFRNLGGRKGLHIDQTNHDQD